MRKLLQRDLNPWVLSVNFSPLECLTVITTRGDVVSLNKHTGSQTPRGVYLAFSSVTVLPMRMSGAATVPVKPTFWTAWAVASCLSSYVITKTNISSSISAATATVHCPPVATIWIHVTSQIHWWSLVEPVRITYFLHNDRKEGSKRLFLSSLLPLWFHFSFFLSYFLLHSLSSPLSWQLYCLGPRGCVVKCCHITL